MRHIFIFVTFGLLSVASLALAQQGQSSVQGRVLDESGLALPGVVVLVTHQDSGMFRQVVSNDDGSYYVTGIVPGPYRITAELAGFKKYERRDVLLEIGRTATLDITLAVGGVEETVTVTAEAPLVDVTSKQIGGNVGRDELFALPNLGRNWLMAVSLMPGIQVQASTASFACESLIVSGGSNRSGNFSVDGGGNNDDYLGSGCGSQTRTAIEAVQEFQVLTNQYDAEFGRTAGAVINAITRQGTNSFHGSAIGAFTDSAITAKDFFVAQQNLTKPDTRKMDAGGTLGGPIIKDKAHFFYSLERISLDEGRSNTFAARPELNYADAQRMRLWNHLIRFDHQINAGNTWSVRFLREDSPLYGRVSGRRSNAARDQEYDVDHTTVGSWNSVFGNTRFNTVRLGRTYEANGFAAAEVQNGARLADLPPTLSMLTFTDGTANNALLRINNAYEVSETFSWFVPEWAGGDHDLKFGAQYIYSSIELPDQTDMNGRFSFATDRAFDPNDPWTYPERLFVRVPDKSNPYLPTHVAVLFAQDKWQRQDLTLNVGVRYDLEISPIHPVNPLFESGGYPVDKNNIAPRIGFTWNPGGSANAVVRGGYGLFYDKVNLRVLTPFVTDGIYSSSFVVSFPTDRADPGPSRGQLPTDAMLVSGPVVNLALLNALYPPGSVARNRATVYIDNPDRVAPSMHQVTIGYERQLGSRMSASADYIHNWNRDQFIGFDLNPGLRVDTSRTGRIVYTDLYNIAGQLGISPFVNPVFTRRNDGVGQFDGLNVQLEKRYSDNWAARVSYAIGYARGNVEADQINTNNFQVLDDPRLDLNYGPTENDRRHNFVVSGRVEVPRTGGLTVSGAYRYMTGVAMSLYNSAVDADRNGKLFDPLPAGRYCGQGENAFCVDNEGGRNGAYGPSFQQFDLRVGYRLRPREGQTLDVYVDLFNIFNTANFSNPTGDLRSSDFLRLVALRGGGGYPSQAQFGVRFGF